eukprot:TRINITY_DN6327_c0_g2_i1.p1 TRINITY_DN6327_c0_g2~~TRINITY_DN6327_c0_g2_i1.p1  ORF type:complete len:136 (-),score=19.72 TRINITY_DN6327_c0_g2_i1:491-898(-)
MTRVAFWGRLAVLATTAYGGAVLVTNTTWDKEVIERVQNGQFVFVKFFVPWCEHCKIMKLDWDKLAVRMNYKTNAYIADVDCTSVTSENLCHDYTDGTYPALISFKKSGDPKGELYNGSRAYNDLKLFAKRSSRG